MNLYIETENGAIKNHPAFEDNLMQAFGEIPAGWEPFVRVERPIPGIYQMLNNLEPIYGKVDGVWTDTWSVRDMTIEEKTAKQQQVINMFRSRRQAENWAAWTLDEATCAMAPPIPRPERDQTKIDAGIFTFWCGAENNWKDTPARLEGPYEFDVIAWDWVALP
jgi:hypothetical protein